MYTTDFDGTTAYNNAIKNVPTLDAKSNKELFIKYNEGNEEEQVFYRNKIIEGNMGLVMKVASEFTNRCSFLAFQDLCQEGVMGLFRAIEKYDVNSGNAFSTYAYDWIRAAIQKGISKNEYLIRKPSYLHKAEKDIKDILDKAKADNKPCPTYEEIAEMTGIQENLVISILETSTIIYGDTPISEDSVIYDTISDDTNLEEIICEKDEINEILTYLKKQVKNEKNLNIFLYRTGFCDGQIHTLEDTGAKFNLSKERIRFIEQRTYQLLRKHFLNNIPFLKAYGHRTNFVRNYK